ncbi:MAG TPA: shikimate kinase [Syntrophomonadaceae bacterium]|nr:shikimate kinase [Syntrophomonadaceae bacterium]
MEMGKNIVLVGFMGTGKSSVGSRLAQRLNMEFIDMDREIEHLLGMPVDRIFKVYGEKRFRSEERLLAEKLAQRENLVIATGGGVVLESENVQSLRKNGMVICLTADAEDVMKRVNRKKGTRPLLKKNLKLEELVKMMKEREALYGDSDLSINTSGNELDEVVTSIVSFAAQWGNR